MYTPRQCFYDLLPMYTYKLYLVYIKIGSYRAHHFGICFLPSTLRFRTHACGYLCSWYNCLVFRCVSIHSPGCSQFFVITNGAAITTSEPVRRVSESTPGMYTWQCHRQIRGSVAAPTWLHAAKVLSTVLPQFPLPPAVCTRALNLDVFSLKELCPNILPKMHGSLQLS